MRRYFLFLISTFCFFFHGLAQKNKADSLASLLAVEKTDSNRVTLLWQIADAMKSNNPDSALVLSQKALELARKIRFAEGESRALGIIANGFVATGNYPRALEYYLKKLALEEKRNTPRNLASVTMNIGIVYFYQEEFDKALIYYKRADLIIATNNVEDFKYNIAVNQGDLFYQLKQYDSSYYYFNRSLEIAVQRKDGGYQGISLVGLGNVQNKKNEFTQAFKSYSAALPYLFADNNEEVICEASLGIAHIFELEGRYDSAAYYARQAMQLSQKDGFLSWQLKAADFFNEHFRKVGKFDSAYAYLAQSQVLRDSVNSKDRIRQSQVLSSNEQLRQAEITEQKLKAKKERMQQLQLLFIGIFIPAFFLLTLILSRRKIHVSVIKFLGIISLLILFEYLTLLLHPYVLDITHHIPVFELLIFVCIAAVLIRLHHKIEHWFIDRLIHGRRRPGDGRLQVRRVKMKKPTG